MRYFIIILLLFNISCEQTVKVKKLDYKRNLKVAVLYSETLERDTLLLRNPIAKSLKLDEDGTLYTFEQYSKRKIHARNVLYFEVIY